MAGLASGGRSEGETPSGSGVQANGQAVELSSKENMQIHGSSLVPSAARSVTSSPRSGSVQKVAVPAADSENADQDIGLSVFMASKCQVSSTGHKHKVCSQRHHHSHHAGLHGQDVSWSQCDSHSRWRNASYQTMYTERKLAKLPAIQLTSELGASSRVDCSPEMDKRPLNEPLNAYVKNRKRSLVLRQGAAHVGHAMLSRSMCKLPEISQHSGSVRHWHSLGRRLKGLSSPAVQDSRQQLSQMEEDSNSQQHLPPIRYSWQYNHLFKNNRRDMFADGSVQMKSETPGLRTMRPTMDSVLTSTVMCDGETKL